MRSPRQKLQIGDICKGLHGPHNILTDRDLKPSGGCRECARMSCSISRAKKLKSDPGYNTKAHRVWREKRVKFDPTWTITRHAKERTNDPVLYVARSMVGSLKRADKLKGRVTHKEVTVNSVNTLLHEALNKPCEAALVCGGTIITLVPKFSIGSPSLDHVNPLVKTTTMSNLKVICFNCNTTKSDITLHQAKALILYLTKEDNENS